MTSAATRVAVLNPTAAPVTPRLIANDFAAVVGSSSAGNSWFNRARRRRRASAAVVAITVIGIPTGNRDVRPSAARASW